jgi:hypothetical protein
MIERTDDAHPIVGTSGWCQNALSGAEQRAQTKTFDVRLRGRSSPAQHRPHRSTDRHASESEICRRFADCEPGFEISLDRRLAQQTAIIPKSSTSGRDVAAAEAFFRKALTTRGRGAAHDHA